jgi:DNA-binding response OmpR family regulator
MKSILLVDDEAAVSVELQRTLQELGYHVEIAHTVESALGSISEARFDAILVEFNLRSECSAHPRTGGGIRLIRDLRKSGTTIPILVYTVMEGETYETASLDAGADDFILKQIPISDFFSRLREHIMMRVWLGQA